LPSDMACASKGLASGAAAFVSKTVIRTFHQ
jgi:hypothetical protein